MKRLLALLFVLAPVFALADGNSPASGPAATGGSFGGQFAQLALGLLLVVALIFGLAWLVRRMQQVGPRSTRAIKLVASQALGPRDRLVLVQVGNEQILLGMTPGRITPLHVLKEPIPSADSEPATPEFAQRLTEMLSRERKEKD
jgi:flagellar protein FliO/FliZ